MDLSNNESITIAESLRNLPKLSTLNLSNNSKLEISEIRNVLACPKLSVLRVSELTADQQNQLNRGELKKLAELTKRYGVPTEVLYVSAPQPFVTVSRISRTKTDYGIGPVHV